MAPDRSSELTSRLSDISAALAQPFYRLRFDRFLEQQFEQSSQAGRNRATFGVLLCAAAIQVPLALNSTASLLFNVSSLVVVAACLLGAALLKGDRSIWLQNAATIAPIVTFIAAETFKGVYAPPAFSDRALVTAGLMACFVNLIVPMRFQAAVLCSGLSFLAFSGILLGGVGHPPPDQIPTVVVSGGSILLSLLVAWRNERNHRRAFLLGFQGMLLNTELNRLARTDPLTGLANRRVFNESLGSACRAAASAEWVALIMVDIDHFKSFNDTLGHAEGDRCLRMVAASMDATMRASDTLARFGGEEFVVVLPNTDPDDALSVAERLRAAVEQLGLSHPVHGVVTVSVGLASVQPQQAWMPAALLEAADDALYRAKQNGRNRVVQAQRPASISIGAAELSATDGERPAPHSLPASRIETRRA